MASPQLEQVKRVAEVLVPVLRAFRAALGEEEANRIACVALEGMRREDARELGRGLGGNAGVEKWRASLAAAH